VQYPLYYTGFMRKNSGGKSMRFLTVLMLLLSVSLTQAQAEVEVQGSGETAPIAYGETVTGEIEVSDANQVTPISYVGHNGTNRSQGDFDAWTFDSQAGDNLIVRMTATSDGLTPTLLVTMDSNDSSIVLVTAFDGNVDGDAEAGVCLREINEERHYTILAFRQGEDQTGTYSLSLEQVETVQDLAGGSETAICSVGSFVQTVGDKTIKIGVPGCHPHYCQMQPQAPYNLYSAGSTWTHIWFRLGDQITEGYVHTPLIEITGASPTEAVPTEN
jgi:hypothetical protein